MMTIQQSTAFSGSANAGRFARQIGTLENYQNSIPAAAAPMAPNPMPNQSQLFSPFIDGYVPPEPAEPLAPVDSVPVSPMPNADARPDPSTTMPEPVEPAVVEPKLTLIRGADGSLYGVRQAIDTTPQPPSSQHKAEKTPSTADSAKAAAAEGRRRERQAEKSNGATLSQAEQKQVDKLRTRDRDVRMHEMAHAAAAGPYALGGPTFSYQVGPDGRQYAVGGHVNIDTSPEETPEQTVLKMQIIRGASVSPDSPSVKDVQVAAHAMMTETRARAEIGDENFTPLSESRDGAESNFMLESTATPRVTMDPLSRSKLDTPETYVMKPRKRSPKEIESAYYPLVQGGKGRPSLKEA